MSNIELIGATEAAKTLGLSRPGFNLRIKNGQVSPVGRVGKRGTYVFDRSEVERLAAESKGARVD